MRCVKFLAPPVIFDNEGFRDNRPARNCERKPAFACKDTCTVEKRSAATCQNELHTLVVSFYCHIGITFFAIAQKLGMEIGVEHACRWIVAIKDSIRKLFNTNRPVEIDISP